MVFPCEPSAKDLQISSRSQSFRWLKPKHLGACLSETRAMWELTNRYLDDLDKASSVHKKLESLKEFMKVITGIILANQDSKSNCKI